MPQYLVAIHHPDDYDPSVETEATIEAIHALNREMIAAGARKLVAGLSSASNARSLRAQPNGQVLITDGPYLETKEHIAGFWVVKAANLDEALAWGRKAVLACRAPEEDTSGGFAYGGWTAPHGDDVSGKAMRRQMNLPFDLLLGRKTFDNFAR